MNQMQRRSRGLRELCRLLGYTAQAYYQYRTGLERRSLKEDLLIQQVLHHRRQQPRLGARKLLVMLQSFMDAHQVRAGRDAFFELLRVNGLLVRRRRMNRPRTTFSGHRLKKYADLVKSFTVTRVDELWVSDITYINLSKGFAYLSLVTDVYSRKIVGYRLSDELATDGPVAALEMAVKGRTSVHPLMHHSDRGSQYCSSAYIRSLHNNNIDISMTQSGDPRDNAIAERVNGILKQELLAEIYPNFKQARQAVASAIEVYNHHRPHSSVDMLTPAKAHTQTGEIRRRWKSYYKHSAKEVIMDG
jgi:transposase InsO family protein